MTGDPGSIGWGAAGAAPSEADRRRFAATFDLMSAVVLDGTGVPGMLALVAARARELARVPLAFVALPGEDGNTLRVEVADGPGGDRIRGLTVRRGRSMLGRAYTSRRAVSARIAADQTLTGLPAGPILILPLETGEATRGVLAVLGRVGAEPFSPATARQMLLFSDMAARVIEVAGAHLPSAPPGVAEPTLRPQSSG
ncbi:GAF domain-containing protein [Actinomadura sp. NPDC048955]|uniref:GAF domain-containing protein n=1 Tax=Actinomadura TaxID=1988 RepID=UPI002164C291|nr:GAF domain-containing protein [Actinomadura glauciflava]MCR3744542.1 GAF domain-containing protein [Actinomadura glauciflava]